MKDLRFCAGLLAVVMAFYSLVGCGRNELGEQPFDGKPPAAEVEDKKLDREALINSLYDEYIEKNKAILESFSDDLLASIINNNSSGLYLLKMTEINNERTKEIEQLGATIIYYRHDNYVPIKVNDENLEKINKLDFVEGVYKYVIAYKAGLFLKDLPDLVNSDKVLEYRLIVNEQNADDVINSIKGETVSLKNEGHGVLRVKSNGKTILSALGNPNVIELEGMPIYPPPGLPKIPQKVPDISK